MSPAADDINGLQDRVRSGISRLKGLEIGDEIAVEILAILIDGRQTPDRYDVEFTGRNLSTGIYLYKLQVGDRFEEVKKMLFVK